MKDDKKKKKGVAIVIAVTPHAPKKPENTMKPDEKMEKAWAVLKEDNAIETEEANRKLIELLAEVKRLREIEREWKQMWSKLEDYPDMSAELTRHIEQQENEQFYDEDIESDMDSLPPDEINEMFRQD
tara:strand:+ start:170 stop:553 length:384 start_codon:yes stop_codon:yes gene_type:complete